MLLNSPTTKISYHVERQFPAIYREEARELIMLVEEYYKFLETQTNQSVYNNRRFLENIDIDRTMQSLLLFYQNKFLSGLPHNDETARFTVKNILDLYRRKGSEEGIRLFFQMFYDQDIEMYYPSVDMLKPSASRWKIGSFLQLYPNQNPLAFQDVVGQKIYGSLSKAEAFVDEVQFVSLYDAMIPVVFLDKVKGAFIGLETIFTTEPTRINRGKIYGSLTEAQAVVGVTANNRVGDIVTVDAAKGYGGKAVVTRVSTTVSGEVTFKVVDGDYGYSAYDANTNPYADSHIILSNQNFLFPNANLEFVIEERVAQDQGGNTWHYATIIGQSSVGVGVLLDNVAEPFVSGDFETLDRANNEVYTINVVSLAVANNLSASANVGMVDNVQMVEVLANDIIGDFLSVPLDANNYSAYTANVEMSGGGADITTPLNEAFIPVEVDVGRITGLTNVFPGIDYNNNAYVLVKDNNTYPYRVKNQILTYDQASSGVPIFVGDLILQTVPITRFSANTVDDILVQGVVTQIVDKYLYVKLRSFFQFTLGGVGGPITREESTVPLTIEAIHNDDFARPVGFDAIITADADFALGRIEAVKITNSGIGYQHEAPVTFTNPRLVALEEQAYADWIADANNDPEDYVSTRPQGTFDGSAIAGARGQGLTEGSWVTNTSHIGFEHGKRIQNSDYYQDYSYEVATSLNERVYLEELYDTAHPAGIKLFTKFALFERINTDIEVYDEIIDDYQG